MKLRDVNDNNFSVCSMSLSTEKSTRDLIKTIKDQRNRRDSEDIQLNEDYSRSQRCEHQLVSQIASRKRTEKFLEGLDLLEKVVSS